jgi:L-lactate dehydrogenase complex protein LldF
MKRVDHVKASREFIADEKHIEFHDKRLWTLRTLRDEAAHGIEEWEQLRSLASGIKEHTLTHLADYLEEFERNATKNGVTVHWAKDAEEHNRIVYEILSGRSAKTLVKSKSMLTEECGMREYLEPRGIAVVETDLGERIQQLDHQRPAHISWCLRFTSSHRTSPGFFRRRSEPIRITATCITSPKRSATRPDH